MKKTLITSLGLGLALAATSAFANTISPGGTGAPDALTIGAGSTLVATISGTISPGTFTADYTENVYSDPTNTFCAGCYDFTYVIHNTGTIGVVERATGFSFDHVILTDVGWTAGGGKAPTSVDRSLNGNVVGFNFLASDEIGAGQTSDVLIIMTNSMNYTQGFVSLQDGTAGSAIGLAPAGVTPEPMSMGLLGGGLALLGVARWRRNKKA